MPSYFLNTQFIQKCRCNYCLLLYFRIYSGLGYACHFSHTAQEPGCRFTLVSDRSSGAAAEIENIEERRKEERDKMG